MILLLTIWEATQSGSADPVWLLLLNYGIAGAVILLLAWGRGLHTHSEVVGLREQVAKLEESNARKDRVIEQVAFRISGEAIPAMTETANVFSQLPRSGRLFSEDLQGLQQQISDLATAVREVRERDAGGG